MTEKEHIHLISQYDGEIAYLDSQIGKLILRLKELGLYEASLIIITSDHGETFGERNLMNHGVSVYQDLVYVPLIIKYPNVEEKKITNDLVSVVDLMPTILDVLNYENPKGSRGESLLSIKPEKPRNVYSESFPGGGILDTHSRLNRKEWAIFSGPFKFISSTAGKKELYDLSKDPNEMKNLYKMDNKIAMDLESKLSQWLEITVPEYDTPSKVEIDKDARERLKALGYIQ